MCAPLNWQSIWRVLQSSLANEALALSDTSDDAVYLMKLFSEVMFNNYKIPIKIVTDNKSLMNHYFQRKT